MNLETTLAPGPGGNLHTAAITVFVLLLILAVAGYVMSRRGKAPKPRAVGNPSRRRLRWSVGVVAFVAASTALVTALAWMFPIASPHLDVTQVNHQVRSVYGGKVLETPCEDGCDLIPAGEAQDPDEPAVWLVELPSRGATSCTLHPVNENWSDTRLICAGSEANRVGQ